VSTSVSRIARAASYAGAMALLWASAFAAAPTGQERAEAVGRALVGKPAPALVVHTIDGDSIDLGALYGKQAVYLKFWATWCGPCRAQMPHFEHTYEAAGPGLAVIGVDTGFNDSLPDVRDAIRQHGLKMPTVIDDGRLAAAFHLRVTPQHIVIGRDGRIEYIGQLADERLDTALRTAQSAAPASHEPVAAATPAATEHREVGDPLPDFSATLLDGSEFRARDARDPRPTVFVFLSPWCESYYGQSLPSRPARPDLATACRKVREQIASIASRSDRLRWLGVASGLWSTPGELRDYQAEYAPGIALMLDASGEWFRSFDVMHVPTIVIADARGRIVKRIEGFDPDLEAKIGRVLAR
jgi:peroxiredoxin